MFSLLLLYNSSGGNASRVLDLPTTNINEENVPTDIPTGKSSGDIFLSWASFPQITLDLSRKPKDWPGHLLNPCLCLFPYIHKEVSEYLSCARCWDEQLFLRDHIAGADRRMEQIIDFNCLESHACLWMPLIYYHKRNQKTFTQSTMEEEFFPKLYGWLLSGNDSLMIAENSQ